MKLIHLHCDTGSLDASGNSVKLLTRYLLEVLLGSLAVDGVEHHLAWTNLKIGGDEGFYFGVGGVVDMVPIVLAIQLALHVLCRIFFTGV